MDWKYILFDLDGTLTDSSEGILNCVRYALEAAEVPVPDRKTMLRFIGPPLVEGFQEITGMSYEDAVVATAKYRERYSVIGLFENQPYEGIALALSRLKSQGKILALATSKPETYSIRILQHFHLLKYFDVTVGSTLDGARNKKPEVIQEVFRRLKLSEEEKAKTIMVGDRRQDIAGAKECGIASLGVYYGFAEPGELEEAGADYVVHAVDEIMRILADDEEEPEVPFVSREETLSDMKYERIDFEAAGKKLQHLFERQKAAKSGEEQLAIHQEYYQLKDHIATMAALAHFRHSIDTQDTFYNEENDYYDEKLPVYENQDVAYQNVLYHSPFRGELEEKIGEVAFENIRLQKKSTDPKLVPLQQEENRLVSEYEKLLASARFDWEGEALSMSELGRYLTDTNRQTRKKAWNLLQDFMQQHAASWDDIYDKLVKNRHQQAVSMGYDNFVTLGYYRMRRNCYDKEQVKGFRKQVKDYLVPFVSHLQEKRRERLGVEKLQLYDNGLYFKEGNPAPQGTPEEILQHGLEMYRDLSSETAEFMEKMLQREMFDVLSRKNKCQGGYMEFLPEPRMPLIFANFNGTSGDVDVITHECGHAFQGYLAGKDDIREHWDITMETAETHSMSMEFFTNPWMKLFFGEDAGRFCRMQLEDAVCFIPYGCMVDEFQQIIYEHPQLNKAQRHEVWRRLEEQYRPHLDLTGMPFFAKGGWWQRQHHIFSTPFYYIDYCIAQVCALQYKMLMSQDYQKAWQSYLKLCKKSASGFFSDMIEEVGLCNPFQEGCISKLVKQLEEYMG